MIPEPPDEPREEAAVGPEHPTRDELVEDDPLDEFHVWPATSDGIEPHREALRQALREWDTEHDLQSFLEDHPELLIHHLGGGHGRYVIPQRRLGAEYEPDFLIGEAHSFGFEWEAVELERPDDSLFTDEGDPTAELRHAIRQIHDWREWLRRNINYARRPPGEDGLGLTEIDGVLPGLILIGRRDAVDPSTDNYRRRILEENRIEVHTWDFLLGFGRAQAKQRRIDRMNSPRG